jgi:hypothetical protein
LYYHLRIGFRLDGEGFVSWDVDAIGFAEMFDCCFDVSLSEAVGVVSKRSRIK